MELDYQKYMREMKERINSLPSIKARIYSFMTNHRDMIELSGEAHCLECGADTPCEEIVEWTDLNTTGICPRCGVDKLVPVLSAEMLNKSYALRDLGE